MPSPTSPRPGRPQPSLPVAYLQEACDIPWFGELITALVLGLGPNLVTLPFRDRLEERWLYLVLGILIVPWDFALRAVGLRLRLLWMPGWAFGLLIALVGAAGGV